MPNYTPPLRDMQFVMHEVLKVTDDLKCMPQHVDTDADTINAILEYWPRKRFAQCRNSWFPAGRDGDQNGRCSGIFGARRFS